MLATAGLFSCSSSPASPGSLRVVVNVEPGLGSRCARVVAQGAAERESSAVALDGRARFVVGIAQNDQPDDVAVQARGYSDEACTTLTVPSEVSELLPARFRSPPAEVMVSLGREPGGDGGVDLDGDGFPSPLDCDDANAAVHPGALESCTNGLDDDCNQATDCADPGCSQQPCGVGGQCTGGRCIAPVETGLCADGLDNDGDGRVDCEDSDCLGAPCNDSNPCTRDDTCGSAGCAGVEVVCQGPPSAQCFSSAGRCLADAGGCSYPVVAGSCLDGLACTEHDSCAADGGCAGTPKRCDTPPDACHAPVGQCSELRAGACVYPPLPTAPCDDHDNCTLHDTCDGDGGCAGARVTCTPLGECFTPSGLCTATGGCLFSLRPGACDGGTCDAAGHCVGQAPVFGYTPSNFTEAQLPPSAGAVVVSCDLTIDTQSGDGGLGWTTCASGPPAPAWNLIPVGGGTALLLFMDSLTLPLGATVQAVGARPLIIAVRGAVAIDGALWGGSGAGSEVTCGAGAGAAGGVSGSPATAGGGGGGGFATSGGQGTDGEHGGHKGERGSANGNPTLIPLRGGCRGGQGGHAAAGWGSGGQGGGALQVSAGGSLTVHSTATLAAQGGGGRGGLATQLAGGGGGGSGGALLLEAMALTVNAGGAVVANGGAGGEGSGASVSGADGQGGQRSTARAGSLPLTCGGDGGGGGARAGTPTDATKPSCGVNSPGGGGGGSAGRVRLNAVHGCTLDSNAVLSPRPTGFGSNCQ